MREVEARNRRRREHREALGQLDAGAMRRIEELPQGRLLGVVGLRRIARRRADAEVLLGDQLLVGERLAGRIAPELAAHLGVHPLGEGLGQTIRESLREDLRIVVVRPRIGLGDRLLADPGRHREGTDPVLRPTDRGDEVGERQIGAIRARTAHLLTQGVEGGDLRFPSLLGIDHDVVALRLRRPEADHALGRERALRHQLLQHRLGVVEEGLGGRSDLLVGEDRRIPPDQLPGGEERRPVDEGNELGDRNLDGLLAQERRLHRRMLDEIRFERPRPCVGDRDALLLRPPTGMALANLRVVGRNIRRHLGLVSTEQRRGDTDRAARVDHIDRLPGVIGRIDLHGGMDARGRRAADQQRHVEALTLHLARHVHHLVERRGDEPGETDDVGLLLAGAIEDRLRRHHHAEVDHVEVVAGQHDADDVLADVVDVALHGRHHDLARRRAALAARRRLFGVHVGHQHGHRLLHHARRLHHLRQEHLARAEEVADHVHAGHQRPLDHVERTARRLTRLLHVDADEVGDAVDERVLQPLGDRCLAPAHVDLARLADLALEARRGVQQALGGIGAAVQHHVLGELAQIRRQIVVDGELAGIDDAEVHPRLNGVVEEHRVHRLAHRLVAPEGERQVRHAARDVGMRQLRADEPRRLDEVDAVVRMLLDAGRHREDVGIEDDVLRREADDRRQDLVGAAADLGLAGERVGLPLLVEGHDDHGGAVATHLLRLLDELRLALLERDRVHQTLALKALQPRLDHRPLRAVDHHRHARDVRLGGDEVEEGHHRLLAVEQALVHVDVDDRRARLDLLLRDRQRRRIVAVGDELAELRRARDVGALADVDEAHLRPVGEGLEARQPHARLDHRHHARGAAGDGLGDGGDVIRRRAAAATDHVDEAGGGELADQFGHRLGALVIEAEFVGQAGVRIGADEGVGDAADLVDVGAHLLGAERAVEADRERLRMTQRVPEGRRSLTRKGASREIGDGAGDHHRQPEASLFEHLLDRIERRLGVQRVEDRLDEENVGAAVDEAARRLAIGLGEIVEGHGAEARIVDVRRDRRGAVGRPDGAGDEARPARIGGEGRVAGLARAPRTFDVEIVGGALEVIVGLRDGRRREGVGLDDVRTRRQILGVNAADDVRPGNRQEIVVALQV